VKFWFDWDWAAAEAALRGAIALDPRYPLAHRNLGIVLSHSGRHEEARLAARRARELDPLHAAHHALSSQIEFNARDYSAAIQFARQATILDPEFPIGYIQLAQAYVQLGNSDLALDALNNAGRFSSNSKLIALRGSLFAKLGRTEDARSVLNTLEAVSRERYPTLCYGTGAGESRPSGCGLSGAGACLRCAGRASRLSSGGPQVGCVSSGLPIPFPPEALRCPHPNS
jgi:tetratricopeptide (TPR) repeat protein